MNITNYSLEPQKPSFIVEWPNARLLLDTPIDYAPFFSFLPHVYQSPRIKNAHIVKKFCLPHIKDLTGKIYVDAPPEIIHTSADSLKMDTIDAILISNYDSFLGLPFFTENTGFSGKIYVTEIAYQYGKLLMEEMIEFMERAESKPDDQSWKKEEICGKFPNRPPRNPVEWRRFYTVQEMHSCLTKVITLSFNQTIDIFRIKITPVVSGHTYGSCYWTLKTENEKIAYLPASNPAGTDVKLMEIAPLRAVDYILVTSLSTLTDSNVQSNGVILTKTVTDVLRKQGSVILPISPVGPIFEMLEAISDIISATNGISVDTPIYFISPVAKSAIAMASISAEWMSESRQKAVYLPEEPYYHNHLIKSGRLRIYDSLYGNFSKEFKTPCVIFTSHSSLRIGDAAHMVEVLGSEHKNMVILTDPDFQSEDVREPFRTLPIQFVTIPMDFRMDYEQLDKMLQDVKPKYVLCPPHYTRLMNRRPDLQVKYDKLCPIGYGESVLLSMLSRNRQKNVRVSVHPDVLKDLKFRQHPTKKCAVAKVACNLSAYDDDFKLVPTSDPPYKRVFGKVTLVRVLRELRKRNWDPIETVGAEETVLEIPKLAAKLIMRNDGKRMKIQSQYGGSRADLQRMFHEFLMEDDGIVGRHGDDMIEKDSEATTSSGQK